MGWHFLLQRVFPTQGSNPGLPHCRQMLYRLSHQGSPFLDEAQSLASFQGGGVYSIYSFTFGCTVSVVAHRLFSSCSKQRLLFSLQCRGFFCFKAWAVERAGSVAVVHRHVGSSGTRDRTHANCISRHILNHCTTRDVQGGAVCMPISQIKRLLLR